MQICTNMSWLRHYQGRLMLFRGGGGIVYNVMLHLNAATLRGLTFFICVLYNVVLENHSVQNSPPGGGGGIIASSRPTSKNVYCDSRFAHNVAIHPPTHPPTHPPNRPFIHPLVPPSSVYTCSALYLKIETYGTRPRQSTSTSTSLR